MELRVNVDDEFMKRLQTRLGTNKSTDIARDALTLLNWAVEEKQQGRQIASADNGGIHARLAMPSLDRVKIQK